MALFEVDNIETVATKKVQDGPRPTKPRLPKRNVRWDAQDA